jgi:hypothetical protein
MILDQFQQPGAYPSVDDILGSPTPERALEVRRSIRSVISGIALFLIACLVVYILNVIFYEWRPPQDIPVVKYLSPRWLAIIPIGIMLELVRRYHDSLYVFTPERVQHYEGRLSLAYSVPSLRYSHIRAITVTQDLLGRIFDYGNIAIGSAGHDGSEIQIHGVRNPRELAQLVYDLKLHQTSAEAANMELGSDTGMQKLVANTD